MPEAPVDEHGDPLAGEHDVWAHPSAGEVDAVVHAVAEPCSMKSGPQRELGFRVPTTVRLHVPAPHGRPQTGILATQEVGGVAVREGVPVRVEERPADSDEDEAVTERALVDDLVPRRCETELLVDRLGLLEP